MTVHDDESLLEKFNDHFWDRYINSIRTDVCGATKHTTTKNVDANTVLTGLVELYTVVESLGLFPRSNEELEEIPSESLQFLMLPFAMGDILNSHLPYEKETRAETLKRTQILWNKYISMCDGFAWESPDKSNSIDPRDIKIKSLLRQRSLIQSVRAVTHGIVDAGKPVDEFRESLLDCVEYFFLQCKNDLRFLEDELCILVMVRDSNTATATPPPKPWSVKLTDPAALRTMFNNQVFRPDISMPTMSLHEFARMELEALKHRPASVSENTSETETSEMKELKDRAWDDWKDDNPRGSGNKMANIG